MRSMKMLCLIIPSLIMAKSVTFDEALQLSLQNNHELKAKKLEVDKAKASLQEAKGSELGVLKFNENISRTNHAGYVFGMKMGQRQATFGDFGFDIHAMSLMTPPTMNDFMQTAPNALNNPEAVTNYETKLTYEIPLFAGFKIQNAKTMMELQIKANEFRYKADEKTLALEVLKAYNGAVAAKQFIKATKMAKEATNAFVHFADEMFKEGFATKIDVKQAEAYDLDVDAKTIEAKNSFDLAIAYLKFLSDDTDISDVNDFKNFDILQANLQDLQRNALQNREDLNWMNLNKETAKVNIDFVNGDSLPMVGLHLEYGYNADNLSNTGDDNDYYMMAAGLEYKIFDGYVNKQKKQKAKLDFQKANYYEQYMQNGIKLEVENNYLTLATKKEVVKQKQKALDLASDVKEKTSELYQNKLTTMTNLLLQEANLEKARAEFIMANYDQALAEAKLQISVGKNLSDKGN